MTLPLRGSMSAAAASAPGAGRSCTGRAAARLLTVAARDHDGDTGAALQEALAELHTRERRCVVALAPPDALLCAADFPPMLPWERASAARFEAARFVDYPIAEAAVSLMRIPAQPRWAIGIARRASLAAVLAAVRRAGLRALAVDDIALALRRAQPAADAIIDIGDRRNVRLMLFGAAASRTSYGNCRSAAGV